MDDMKNNHPIIYSWLAGTFGSKIRFSCCSDPKVVSDRFAMRRRTTVPLAYCLVSNIIGGDDRFSDISPSCYSTAEYPTDDPLGMDEEQVMNWLCSYE